MLFCAFFIASSFASCFICDVSSLHNQALQKRCDQCHWDLCDFLPIRSHLGNPWWKRYIHPAADCHYIHLATIYIWNPVWKFSLCKTYIPVRFKKKHVLHCNNIYHCRKFFKKDIRPMKFVENSVSTIRKLSHIPAAPENDDQEGDESNHSSRENTDSSHQSSERKLSTGSWSSKAAPPRLREPLLDTMW